MSKGLQRLRVILRAKKSRLGYCIRLSTQLLLIHLFQTPLHPISRLPLFTLSTCTPLKAPQTVSASRFKAPLPLFPCHPLIPLYFLPSCFSSPPLYLPPPLSAHPMKRPRCPSGCLVFLPQTDPKPLCLITKPLTSTPPSTRHYPPKPYLKTCTPLPVHGGTPPQLLHL